MDAHLHTSKANTINVSLTDVCASCDPEHDPFLPGIPAEGKIRALRTTERP